jgi:serine/threonine protein kinase
MKESEGEENGPFVPRLYEIAYNKELDEAYIVSERMTGTLLRLLQKNTKQENDKILPGAITEIAESLRFFGDRLQFNHRDLKPDNIMYSTNSYGAYSYKLIDFGLSCLHWKGVEIKNRFFSSDEACFKKDRDIPQLLYSLLVHVGQTYISNELMERFDSMLVSKVQEDRECFMLEGCQKEGMKNWGNTYTFLNRKNVSVPSGNMNRVKRHMNNFRKGKQFQTTNTQTKRLYRNTRKLNRNIVKNIHTSSKEHA